MDGRAHIMSALGIFVVFDVYDLLLLVPWLITVGAKHNLPP